MYGTIKRLIRDRGLDSFGLKWVLPAIESPRSQKAVTVATSSCLFAGVKRLSDGEVAIGAVRNHRLTRLKTELAAIELHRDRVRLSSGTRNRPMAPGESGPCCQDSATALPFDMSDRQRSQAMSLSGRPPTAA